MPSPFSSLPLGRPHALPQVIIEFLKTGRYRWWVPFVSSVRFTEPRAPKANDFVGLNYYRLVRLLVGEERRMLCCRVGLAGA